MAPRRLSVECQPFDRFEFHRLVDAACHGGWGDHPPDQVAYLASYLANPACHARTVVIERPYVDRHFLEEYAAYYASTLRPPERDTVRIHLFDREFDDGHLALALERAAGGEYETVREELNRSYLGFAAVRPIPDAPVGRTVLRPYSDLESRFFEPASTAHRVHLLGFELSVPAVPFQQQEKAAGACATTAVWAALASAMRASGRRTPTPFSVTEAATLHTVQNRVVPAVSGLGLEQMAGAIRYFGFEPYVLKADKAPALFALILKLYLRSGVPAVLLLEPGDGSVFDHAVAAVGYREDDDDEWVKPLEVGTRAGMPRLRSAGISRVYVHDDRLGPYARMKWAPPGEDGGSPTVTCIGVPDQAQHYSAEPQGVYAAIYPLYPKLRLSGRSLLELAGDVLSQLRGYLDEVDADRITVEPWFELGGRYLASVLTEGRAEPGSIETLVRTMALPRYVGVVRFAIETARICDVLYDTTDILRDRPRFAAVLGVLTYDTDYRELLNRIVQAENADWVVVA